MKKKKKRDEPKKPWPLVTKRLDEAFKNLLLHVDKGCFTDPANYEPYAQLKNAPVTNLPVYIRTRGTSGVEAGNKQWNAMVHLVSRLGATNGDMRVLNLITRRNHKQAVKYELTGSPWPHGWTWWMKAESEELATLARTTTREADEAFLH